MTPRAAAELLFPGLGLANINAGMLAEIKDAYRIHAKADHPDNGGDGSKITALKQARDVLLSYASGERPKCHVCHGDGEVISGSFKKVPCPKGCKKPETRSGPSIRRKINT